MNDQYLQFKIEDFLSDDLFVNWVLDGSNDEQWLEWIRNNEGSRSFIEGAKQTVLQLRFKESTNEEVNQTKHRVWEKIEQSTETKTIFLTPSRRKWLYSIAAAAAIALLGIVLIPERPIIVTSEMVNADAVILPAESRIKLSSESKISYKTKNWSESRNVALDGAAQFKVSKGVSFSVSTENGSVEVLGTEFDVVSVEDIFQVKVTEGRVSASSGNHRKILTAGMAFYLNPKWEGKNALNPDWRAQEIYFAFIDQPLSEVLKAIQFYTGLSFENNGVDTTISYTGSFDTSEGAEISLETVLWPLGINFEKNSKTIILGTRN